MKIQKSDWLSKRLLNLGKTKAALADALNMRPQHVNRLEMKIKLKPRQFTELARFLDVNEKNLIDFWEDRICEESLFSVPFDSPTTQAIEKNDLIMLMVTIDDWLKSVRKELPIDKKIELAYLIYDDVKAVPPSARKAEVIKFVEILNKADVLKAQGQ